MKIVFKLFIILIVLFNSSQSFSASVRDQFQYRNNGSAGYNGSRSLAQTFTAGLSGTLDTVEFRPYSRHGTAAYPTTVSIWDTINGLPSTQLGSIFYSDGFVYDPANTFFVMNFLSENISINSGNQYAIVFNNDDPSYNNSMYVNWVGTGEYADYLGGELLENVGNGWAQIDFIGAPADMVFSTHISGVPEPTSILLIVSGIAGLAGLRRKK